MLFLFFLYFFQEIFLVLKLIIEIPNKGAAYTNSFGIPMIKGNLKYPAQYNANFQFPSCQVPSTSITSADDGQILRQSEAKNCCMPNSQKETELENICPAGVEVPLFLWAVQKVDNLYGILF